MNSRLAVTLTVEELEQLVTLAVAKALDKREARNETDEPALLDVARLGKRLGVSRSTVYRWLEMGMPSIKVGATQRFEERAVVDWMRRQG